MEQREYRQLKGTEYLDEKWGSRHLLWAPNPCRIFKPMLEFVHFVKKIAKFKVKHGSVLFFC